MVTVALVIKLQRFALEHIAKDLVIQGPGHKINIIEYLSIIINAAEDEFTEDNRPTVKAFLMECFDEAMGKKNESNKHR